MSSLLKLILKNSSIRILVYVFAMIVGITIFFLVLGYNTQMRIYEKGVFQKLSSIANTVALQIDGDMHQTLYEKYTNEGQLKSTTEDDRYFTIHHLLNKVRYANKMQSPIYTMVYSEIEQHFNLCVFSDSVFWRSPWKKFRTEHINFYTTGGQISPYTDEHGTWLSAMAPIKNSIGEVVAVVQADEMFDDFIWKARKEIAIELLVSLVIISIVAYILLRSIRGILYKEEALNREIIQSNKIIEQKNKDITDSILYAKRIQQAILPSTDRIYNHLPESFVLFLPRDIVSGDFYWMEKTPTSIFLAAADCTGHGVPGAMVSVVCANALTKSVLEVNICDTGNILDRTRELVIEQFSKSSEDVKDGMDISIVTLTKQTLQWSGANNPLWIIRSGASEVEEIKPDKQPIGKTEKPTPFRTHTIHLSEGDTFYLVTDGFQDQFGGEKSKKLKAANLKKLLLSIQDKTMPEQKLLIETFFDSWKGVLEQIDDVCILGIRITPYPAC